MPKKTAKISVKISDKKYGGKKYYNQILLPLKSAQDKLSNFSNYLDSVAYFADQHIYHEQSGSSKRSIYTFTASKKANTDIKKIVKGFDVHEKALEGYGNIKAVVIYMKNAFKEFEALTKALYKNGQDTQITINHDLVSTIECRQIECNNEWITKFPEMNECEAALSIIISEVEFLQNLVFTDENKSDSKVHIKIDNETNKLIKNSLKIINYKISQIQDRNNDLTIPSAFEIDFTDIKDCCKMFSKLSNDYEKTKKNGKHKNNQDEYFILEFPS